MLDQQAICAVGRSGLHGNDLVGQLLPGICQLYFVSRLNLLQPNEGMVPMGSSATKVFLP